MPSITYCRNQYNKEVCGRFVKYWQTKLQYKWEETNKIWWPDIVFCNRLTKCAGYYWPKENLIKFSNKMLNKYPETMLKEIFPHEFAHFVQYQVFGEEFWHIDDAHGEDWIKVMRSIDCIPKRYHQMKV